jgi:hypothetical protein
MTMDAEVERHRQFWVSFTNFLKWGTVSVIVLLALLAIFLV